MESICVLCVCIKYIYVYTCVCVVFERAIYDCGTRATAYAFRAMYTFCIYGTHILSPHIFAAEDAVRRISRFTHMHMCRIVYIKAFGKASTFVWCKHLLYINWSTCATTMQNTTHSPSAPPNFPFIYVHMCAAHASLKQNMCTAVVVAQWCICASHRRAIDLRTRIYVNIIFRSTCATTMWSTRYEMKISMCSHMCCEYMYVYELKVKMPPCVMCARKVHRCFALRGSDASDDFGLIYYLYIYTIYSTDYTAYVWVLLRTGVCKCRRRRKLHHWKSTCVSFYNIHVHS